MTWGRMDDKFHRNKKVRALLRMRGGREALGTWVYWWSWCLDDPDLTGSIPKEELSPADLRSAQLLSLIGLWVEYNDCYTFNDFHEYNPTRAQVESKKLADRERVFAKRHGIPADVASDSYATPKRLVSDSEAIRTRVASTRVPNPTHPNQERESGATSDAAQPPERASKPKAPDTHSAAIADPDVIRLLAVYRELHGKDERWNPAAKEGKHSRAAHIFRALHGLAGDRLTAEEIEYAFRGNHADEWHRSRGKHEIEYVLRPSKVGQFIAAGKAPGSPQKAAEQDGRGVALAEIKKRHDEALRAANECALRGDDEGKVRLTLEAKNLRAEFARIREAS